MRNELIDFDGKLASVYMDLPDPITLTKKITVFFINDGHGKPVKSEVWPELVGTLYDSHGNNFIARMKGSGREVMGGFLPSQTFEEEVALKDLWPESAHRKRVDYLQFQGFLVLEPYRFGSIKPKIKDAEKLLKAKTWDEAYNTVDTSIIDRIYQQMPKELQDSEVLPRWTGVVYITNKGMINWEVEA